MTQVVTPQPTEAVTASLEITPQGGRGRFDAIDLVRGVVMVLMALEIGKGDNGTVIKDNIRKVTQGGGKPVDNAVDGLKAIAAGEKVDYAGASRPCDFDDKGDILACQFRFEQIKAGKPVLVKIA